MSAMTVAEVPTSNTLADIDPEDNPALNANYPGNATWHALGGHPLIITAWNGACYDPVLDEWWWPNQGGHTDYAGNEPYKLGVRVASPEFVMVRPPSGALTSSPFVAVIHDIARTQAGSTSTAVVLSSGDNAPVIYGGTDAASDVDDAYTGGKMTINNQIVDITAYSGATHTATVSPAVTGTMVGVSYLITVAGTVVHGNRGEQLMRYADGRVRSTHSYNTPVFIPGSGPAMAYTGASALGGQTGTREFIHIHPVTGEATFGQDIRTAAASIADGQGAACYDAQRHAV